MNGAEMTEEALEQDVTEEPVATEVEAEAEELIVTLGDEATEEEGAEPEGEEVEGEVQDTKVIRMLRRKAEEAAKVKAELRDVKRKLAEHEAKQAKAPDKIVLPPRPKAADFDWNEEAHADAVLAWSEIKRKVEAQEAEARSAREAEERTWKARVDGYNAAKQSLKVEDYEGAEASAMELLSVTQQGIILQGCESPALMVYALGRNPEEAKKLAAIKDPVQFAFAVAKMEATKLKATPRKPASAPEKPVTGHGQPASATNAKLEQLRETAERTGDYKEYFAAKRKLAG